MKRIKITLLSLALVLGLFAIPVVPVSAAPADDISAGVQSVGGKEANSEEFTDSVKRIVDTLLFLLGLVAVIIIILGGFRYATSNGDANATKAAKDMILYAVIGLIVAIIAYAIVNFIVSTFSDSGASS